MLKTMKRKARDLTDGTADGAAAAAAAGGEPAAQGPVCAAIAAKLAVLSPTVLELADVSAAGSAPESSFTLKLAAPVLATLASDDERGAVVASLIADELAALEGFDVDFGES